MIGPPLWKLSIRKLELNIPGFAGAGVGEAAGLGPAGLAGAGDSSVTGSEAPGTGTPGLAAMPGANGAGVPSVGKVDAGLPVAGAVGVISGGAGGVGAVVGGVWLRQVSANAVEQRQPISSFFIIEVDLPARVPVTGLFIPKRIGARRAKLFTFFRIGPPWIGRSRI